jgi:Domain of unknown function (DUF4349)
MKQAHTVKDTLDVSEKLSDVRDRIERLQAQIQLMTHDIEMSVVTIALTQEFEARAFGIHWRPLKNARAAVRDLLEGLGDWVDFSGSYLHQTTFDPLVDSDSRSDWVGGIANRSPALDAISETAVRAKSTWN